MQNYGKLGNLVQIKADLVGKSELEVYHPIRWRCVVDDGFP